MEALSALRCVPRRSVLCFLLSFAMFLSCAFYTLFVDSGVASSSDPVAFKFVVDDVIDYEGGEDSKKSGPVRDTRTTNPNPPPNATLNSGRSRSNSVQVTIKSPTRLLNVSTALTATTTTTTTTTSSTTTVAPPIDTCQPSMKDPKLILLWTSFFDYWDYLPREHFNRCTRCRNCRVTTDRSRLLESDAVIFHARDMSVIDMPPVRLPRQRWVFYCLESPPYSDFPGLQHTQNMFNWTMTYRADSDIASPYGYVSKVRPPRKLDLQLLEWAWSNKSKSVVWMSSHCPTHGGRDLFAMELSKYIDVDIYGTCGTSICPPGETDRCLQEFAQKYKFFLAFENSLCRDYITEKFYRTLKYNIIPVVFGGADYSKFAPPGSYVDALSFKSPKHLAFFLSGVGKNFKLYSSFFKWRRAFAISLSNNKECQLCSMLHKKNSKPSSYENLREWWVQGSNCRTWKQKR